MTVQTDWRCWRDPSHTTINITQFGWPQCKLCGAAPAYHERPDYLPTDLALNLYVPIRRPARIWIADRAAIVGLPLPNGRINAYYEGWIHGPAQYGDRDARGLWEAGVLHAAGRMVTAYPTSAAAWLPETALLAVGTYNPMTHTIVVTNEAALNGWLGA